MTRDRDNYLFDLLDACRFLLGLTGDKTVEKYVRDRMFRGAGSVACSSPSKSGAGM